ncbi:catechol oxidase [Ranunculus cassubicifolius]
MAGLQVNCCPPYTTADMVDFVAPKGPLRICKPAHKLKHEEIEKYKLAISKMKALPADDPWNYYQQATIHCTYCNGAFDQKGFEDQDVLLQIHRSWLFAPWHRYYIYFWEKILGKLIGDPTFAIPFWSWDTPNGMFMPKPYLDTSSSLYNDNRNHGHYDTIMDYDFTFGKPNPAPEEYEEITIRNLKKIHNMFTETIGAPSLFLGAPLRAGQKPDIAGSLENQHGLPHQWTGPEATLFFGHHANVDRLWDIYSDLRGNKVEFNDPDWLEASFIFYDENRKVVKCKGLQVASETRALDSTIRVLVPRPKTSQYTDEKEEAAEVVVVEKIKFGHGESIKFDVYIAKPIEGLVGPDLGELAGSFVRVTHNHNKKSDGETFSKIELGITNLLDDIAAEASDSIVVSLVPQHGNVTIGGVHIDLFDSDI